MKVRFKKLHEKAVLPIYAKPGDAGLDLTVTDFIITGTKQFVKFGLAVEIPKGYVGLIFPRSSIHKSHLTLSNSVGVIDSGYRGEISAIFYLDEIAEPYKIIAEPYKIGERACQMIIVPYPNIEPEFADELSETERGMNGYGSSGR